MRLLPAREQFSIDAAAARRMDLRTGAYMCMCMQVTRYESFLFTSLDRSNRSVASNSDICGESTVPTFLQSPCHPSRRCKKINCLCTCVPFFMYSPKCSACSISAGSVRLRFSNKEGQSLRKNRRLIENDGKMMGRTLEHAAHAGVEIVTVRHDDDELWMDTYKRTWILGIGIITT